MVLTTALRHVVRRLHEDGEWITFSTQSAVDRISLKRNNLPTEPKGFLVLEDEIFEHRREDRNFNEVYKGFVKAHGRVVFDSKEPRPHCYVHTGFPN